MEDHALRDCSSVETADIFSDSYQQLQSRIDELETKVRPFIYPTLFCPQHSAVRFQSALTRSLCPPACRRTRAHAAVARRTRRNQRPAPTATSAAERRENPAARRATGEQLEVAERLQHSTRGAGIGAAGKGPRVVEQSPRSERNRELVERKSDGTVQLEAAAQRDRRVARARRGKDAKTQTVDRAAQQPNHGARGAIGAAEGANLALGDAPRDGAERG